MTASEKVLEWMKKYYKVNGTPNYGEIIAQLEMAIEEEKQGQKLPIHNVSISLHDYEYEMLIDDEGTPFQINSWIPIATDRIKDPSRIDEYIAKGLIRKR